MLINSHLGTTPIWPVSGAVALCLPARLSLRFNEPPLSSGCLAAHSRPRPFCHHLWGPRSRQRPHCRSLGLGGLGPSPGPVEPLGRIGNEHFGAERFAASSSKVPPEKWACALNTKHPRKVSLSSQASEVLLGKEGEGCIFLCGAGGNFFFFCLATWLTGS